MPSLDEIRDQLSKYDNGLDFYRKKYLKELSELTNRNAILYYSGWLHGNIPSVSFGIDDNDINAFMSCIHGLDKTKGLDLILHTPGGEVGATESIVHYLRQIFGIDIRVIVPQIAMSGGTMIACSSKEILMGKQSSLGPIDPQYRGVSAQGVLSEFKKAQEDVKKDQASIPLWHSIISKYTPTLIGECQNAIKWSEGITREWLKDGMLKDEAEPDSIIDRIMSTVASHDNTKSHERHISATKAKEIGLKVTMIEEEQKLQDAILSVHHSAVLALSAVRISKIIENQNGTSMIGTYELPK